MEKKIDHINDDFYFDLSFTESQEQKEAMLDEMFHQAFSGINTEELVNKYKAIREIEKKKKRFILLALSKAALWIGIICLYYPKPDIQLDDASEIISIFQNMDEEMFPSTIKLDLDSSPYKSFIATK